MGLSSLLYYVWSVILVGQSNDGNGNSDFKVKQKTSSTGFQMPLHYPRYKKQDYEKMEEWRLDLLLQQYGLSFNGLSLDEKRCYVMGAFLWPCQL
ncbi:hypothetical protein LXL04_026989 [Taraxacum kok-saghyz]